MSKPIITVFGATGAQGGGLARALLADPRRHFAVRAVTRKPDSAAATALRFVGAEIVLADLDDGCSVQRALEGAYGAFFVTNFWEGAIVHNDANNLLTLLQTWYDGDISDSPAYGGDFDKALGAIKARTVIMPEQYDSYFPPTNSEYEASKIPGAVCRVIPSIWGHMTLWNPDDRGFIDAGLSLALGE